MGERTQVTRVVGRGADAVRMVRGCRIEVLSGADRGRTVVMDRPLWRVGSHASNDLVLADETVSRHHLEIAVSPDGWRLLDLGSSNGTRLGATRLGEVTVDAAVVLSLGQARLALEPAAAEVPVSVSASTRFQLCLGRSLAMRELFAQLEAVAKSDCTVLIEGESGVGKERVAESVHRESARAGGPFVVVDCAALAGGLMESELFGHVRGAFTGAGADRVGLVELADGGTLFLDEVGELPAGLQAKLLGVLERRRVTPVGASSGRKIDVRVVAATHRNLPRAVNEGLFRAELFYRLAVARLRIPPLRERLDDLPLLVDEILGELRRREGDSVPSELSAVALARLLAQPWPGNVRELRNTVEQAALAARDPAPGPLRSGSQWRAGELERALPYAEARDRFVQDFEERYLAEALEQCLQNVSEAARRAGIDRRNFQRMLRRYQIACAKRPR